MSTKHFVGRRDTRATEGTESSDLKASRPHGLKALRPQDLKRTSCDPRLPTIAAFAAITGCQRSQHFGPNGKAQDASIAGNQELCSSDQRLPTIAAFGPNGKAQDVSIAGNRELCSSDHWLPAIAACETSRPHSARSASVGGTRRPRRAGPIE